jgi:CheY-like chemotaxis protein
MAAAEIVPVADAADVSARLTDGEFDLVLADPATLTKWLTGLRRDEVVLGHLDKGVAVLDPAGTVTWANPALRALCPADPLGRPLIDALGAQTLASEAPDPLAAARRGQSVTFRLFRPASPERPYLDVTVRPVVSPDGAVEQLVALARNVTAEVEQQKKLDALHQAGRELAGLDPDQLAEMNLPTRVELLKQNLRRYIRDLLKYDIIEVRLLDRRTGELKPLLEDGMSPEAAGRKLYARPEGNGVTGYVAATGESYLCEDTARDPLYIQGSLGAHSSMTVPLKYNDEVIGTLNVESPRPNGFEPEDLQFTELFSREIAAALHTLDLLTAQQSCTAAQSIDAINKQIALPVDDVLGSAAVLLAKYAGDADAAGHLHRILAGARAVKDSIRKVARDMAAETEEPAGPTPLAGKRVLVVDPDERIRKSAHLLLGRLGAETETTGTASEGVAMLSDSPFDAVLLDIKPPDMGGYEAFGQLRAARDHPPLIAMMTVFGYDAGHAIVKARQDGMKHVIFKPFQQDQLVKTILDGTPPGNGKP